MPFRIERNDITVMRVDAIVNAANNTLLGGGGVDGAIHAAAGPELLNECRSLGGCETGDAKITKGYNLPAKYIIHTVGPIWHGGDDGEEEKLRSCYRRCLETAVSNGVESIAFPLISAGAYGYPKNAAFDIAVDEISRFLVDHDMEIILTVFDKSALVIGSGKFSEIKEYIDDNYVAKSEILHPRSSNEPFIFASKAEASGCASMPPKKEKKGLFGLEKRKSAKTDGGVFAGRESVEKSEYLLPADASLPSFKVDESFSEMLLRLIDEKGLTDSQCYYRANIDRKLFSKIRCNKDYRPSKETAVAFAVALELDTAETDELLSKAGYTLSRSILFDVIIRYFIENKKYNIFEINEALFSFDQKCI